MSRIWLLSAAVLTAVPALAPARAEDDIDPAIIVTAHVTRYAELDGSTATGTPTPLLDVPQSVSVLTRARLDDQALLSIADALRYVPGVTVGQGEGHRDQPTIRGNNTTADFFVDGLRDDVQYFRDFYNVERLEILKGPNALTFGRGGGGGVINRVSKVPRAERFAAFDAAVDTYGSYRLGADLNQPLGGGVGVRVNGVYEDLDNHRDVYDGERYAITPSVAVDLGGRGTFGASYEYVRDRRVVDRGVPSVDLGVAGATRFPLEGFDETFFGAEGINETDFEAHIGTLYASYRLSDALTVRSRLLYGDYDKSYANVFPATPLNAAANTLGVEAYRDITGRRNLLSQTDLILTGDTGALSHVVLFGVEAGRQRTDNERINGFFSATAPAAGQPDPTRRTVGFADPLVVPPVFFRAGPGNRAVHTEADSIGVYVQDQITLGRFELIAGIRYDRFKLRFDNRVTAARFEQTDDLWSPRAGLVYKPVDAASVYVSYSRSFLPQSGDQFLSLDLTSAALEPEKFENYEVGAKWDITPRLNATAALYILDRTNTRAAGPVAGTVVQTGEQRSKGLELAMNGEIVPGLQTSLGYALQDAEVRATTAAAPAGRKVPQVPRHQVSAWNRYDFNDRIGAGLGIVHQSRSFASISNAVVLPAYTRVDAAVFVNIGGGFEAQVNVENLLGEDYFPTAHNDNNISTGGPTSARLTVRKRF